MGQLDLDELINHVEEQPQEIDKELQWMQEKTGFFSASELERLMSKTDTWTEANIKYLYEIQYQRRTGTFISAPANRNFKMGRENEPRAVEWLRENYCPNVRHYAQDFDDKLFYKTDFGYGFSPDADVFVGDKIQAVIEIKSAVGNEEKSLIFSPTFPYDKKRMRVWEEHKWQIIGQFVGWPWLETVHLLKYDGVDDDNPTDLRPVTDPTRGVLFTFKRNEAGAAIDRATTRLKFANNFLNEGNDPSQINEYYKKRKRLFV